ncbi:hypothetical protein AMQ83_01095, partial [Paenibacillus riograndensis]
MGPDAGDNYKQLKAVDPVDAAARVPPAGALTVRQGVGSHDMYMAMRAGVGVGGHAHSDALSLVGWPAAAGG